VSGCSHDVRVFRGWRKRKGASHAEPFPDERFSGAADRFDRRGALTLRLSPVFRPRGREVGWARIFFGKNMGGGRCGVRSRCGVFENAGLSVAAFPHEKVFLPRNILAIPWWKPGRSRLGYRQPAPRPCRRTPRCSRGPADVLVEPRGKHDPETEEAAPVAWAAPVAVSTPATVCMVRPATTPEDAVVACCTLVYPSAPIERRTFVVVVRYVLAPFPNVAVYVRQSPAVVIF
jgi:hypothetical protein